MTRSMHSLLRPAGALLLAVSCLGMPCFAAAAQSATAAEDQAARIKDLERRIADLEAALKSGTDAASREELQRRLDLIAAELESLRVGEAAKPRELQSMYGLGPGASKVYSED